jgi:hypothetical protein
MSSAPNLFFPIVVCHVQPIFLFALLNKLHTSQFLHDIERNKQMFETYNTSILQ